MGIRNTSLDKIEVRTFPQKKDGKRITEYAYTEEVYECVEIRNAGR